MRTRLSVSLLLVTLLACVCYAGQAGAKKTSDDKTVIGTWSGTWEGGSTGKFEITLTGADGKLAGTLTANPEGGTPYTVKLTSVTVSGNKLSFRLNDPEDEVEIAIEATVDSSALKGTYAVRPKGQSDPVESGTLSAKKK